jgi:hypothetical protein
MPRYYFHIMDGHALIDTEGTEVRDLSDARSQAIDTAGSLLSEKGRELWGKGREWTMTVADDTGLVVFTLCFSADEHDVTAPAAA